MIERLVITSTLASSKGAEKEGSLCFKEMQVLHPTAANPHPHTTSHISNVNIYIYTFFKSMLLNQINKLRKYTITSVVVEF